MAIMKKIAGLVAGASAVAVLGVAMAQGVPPNPFIANHAQAAGQQSTFLTSMGETGVPPLIDQVQTAEVVTVQPVAVAPAPVIVERPVAVAPAPVQEVQQMGAAPAPIIVQEPAPVMVPKADRG